MHDSNQLWPCKQMVSAVAAALLISVTCAKVLRGQVFNPATTAAAIPTTTVHIRDICRVKGQEENTLQGMGLVVGLKGTGDESNKPTIRALARMTQLLGGAIAVDGQGFPIVDEVEDSRNVAAVTVTVKVPPAGVQQGDTLDCHVNALQAKSLEGGRLMIAQLLGPRADQPVVYALAEGRITIPDAGVPTSGIIHRGCKMEADIKNNFVENGTVTLILDQSIASFENADFIEHAIEEMNQAGLSGDGSVTDSYIDATAIDQHHVEVKVPKAYDSSVRFVGLLMDIPLANIKSKKRVIINERDGVIIIDEDVVINPVAITHKNLSIEAQGAVNGFTGVDITGGTTPRPKLKSLVEALNGLNVPTQDMINIIRTLHEKGGIYGELTFL